MLKGRIAIPGLSHNLGLYVVISRLILTFIPNADRRVKLRIAIPEFWSAVLRLTNKRDVIGCQSRSTLRLSMLLTLGFYFCRFH